MKKLNLKGVSIQTWTRTIVLFLALVSNVLVIFGKRNTEIDMDKTAEILTTIFTVVASVWSWWKNNSFTANAQKADKVKDGEITIPCGENETSIIISDEK